MAEVIRRANVFVRIDSGPAHLANAVGTPDVSADGRLPAIQELLVFSRGFAGGSTATLLYNLAGPASALTVDEVLRASLARLDVVRMGRPTRACA
jgi:heptosyltransferase-3